MRTLPKQRSIRTSPSKHSLSPRRTQRSCTRNRAREKRKPERSARRRWPWLFVPTADRSRMPILKSGKEEKRNEAGETEQAPSFNNVRDEAVKKISGVRNEIERDSSYPGERGIGLHRCVAQRRQSEKCKRNGVEQKPKCQTACQECAVILVEFSECGREPLVHSSEG
jgi:hypothetical protein